jgi:hypothetical protein
MQPQQPPQEPIQKPWTPEVVEALHQEAAGPDPPPTEGHGGPDPVDQVVNFLIEGHGNRDIIEYLESQQMPAAEAKAVFEDALKKFIKAANLPKAVRRGLCLEMYRDLYRRLVATGDYAGALRAVQELAKLSDVQPVKGDKSPETDKVRDEIVDFIDDVLAL